MPKVSLVVCLRGERGLLRRLLQHSAGCFDELVVVHDGPEAAPHFISSTPKKKGRQTPEVLSLPAPAAPPLEIARDYAGLSPKSTLPPGYRLKTGKPRFGSIHGLVTSYGGRFFEGPRCFQQEPHWPFGWWAAKHDWILRLDADELPSKAMRIWTRAFRKKQATQKSISGFTAFWPLWDGRKNLPANLPSWRPFLINRRRVSFLGMAEQGPIPDLPWHTLNLTLHHRPRRKSFGLWNLLFRKQAYSWRKCIASSLLRPPQTLPLWRYYSSAWPVHWEKVRTNPWRTGAVRFFKSFYYDLVVRRRRGFDFVWEDTLATALHQLLLAWSFGITRLISSSPKSKQL